MKRRILLAIVVALLVVVGAGSVYLMRDPLPRFMERRSAIASVTAGTPLHDGESPIQPIRLAATSGLAVDLAVHRHR